MKRSTGDGAASESGPGREQRTRRRPRNKLSPACESLDGRQLLSTVAAAPVALSAPPAAAVATAAADLNALDPTLFAAFEKTLTVAEGRSHVTQAQAGKLAQDEAAIDQAINVAGLDANTTSAALHHAEDVIDGAFRDTTYHAKNWAAERQKLQQYLAGVPDATPLIDRTIALMQVVARAARVSPQVHDALSAEWQTFADDLGPNPDTDLGPGATDRDPLEVYYNGQVMNYVK